METRNKDPKLVKSQDRILEIIREEEQSFSRLVPCRIEASKSLPNWKRKWRSSLFLYDTLGFPFDVTEQMAQEAGLSVDTVGFTNRIGSPKASIVRSAEGIDRSSSDGASALELIAEQTAALQGPKYKWDVHLPATVMSSIFSAEGFLVDGGRWTVDGAAANKGNCVGLVLDKSSFNAEAGVKRPVRDALKS